VQYDQKMAAFVRRTQADGIRRELAAAATPELQAKLTERLVKAEQSLCEASGGPPAIAAQPAAAPADERLTPREHQQTLLDQLSAQYQKAQTAGERARLSNEILVAEAEFAALSHPRPKSAEGRGRKPLKNIVARA
jgi:hypothetical protein